MKMRFYRPTWAEVNLANLAHNFRQIKKMISPQTKIMVTVKADAYGHGLIPVAKKVVSCGADFLGVASVDEGIKIRVGGINIPVLVLGAILKKDIPPVLNYNLTPTICDEDFSLALNRLAGKRNKKVNVHIKVDTGMGRVGVMPQEAERMVEKINKLHFINIEGIFTHLASADTDKDFTFYQIDIFNQLIQRLRNKGIAVPLIHSANSIGTINYKNSHFNMVRPGLVIYGLYPKKGLKINLKAVLSLKTKVVFIKRVPAGYSISYGRTYFTKKPTTIVTIPIGYGDGYPRNLSNRGPVLIKGRCFKICGRICMDQIMVDVGDLNVKIGDEAVLIGNQGRKRICAEELAELAETIPYDIVCGLGNRIPRIYT
ncbi:MAG: alanine racemase [Candidatus Omnitrophica bacterium]|nr:alanine racemase [Candidatus Omnitrophota bacterium]